MVVALQKPTSSAPSYAQLRRVLKSKIFVSLEHTSVFPSKKGYIVGIP